MLTTVAAVAGGCAKADGEPRAHVDTAGVGQAGPVDPMTTVSRLPNRRAKAAAKTARRERNGRPMVAAMVGATGPSLLPSLGTSGAHGREPAEGVDTLLLSGDLDTPANGCPAGMVPVGDRFCVDKYEASLVEVLPNGDERAWSPYTPVEGHVVRAVSVPGVVPQGYISGNQAAEACARSGKRLCKPREWVQACMGPAHQTYGYGEKNEPHRCNNDGRSPVIALYAQSSNLGDHAQWNWEKMNDPTLNQLDRTVAPTGSHEGCTNDYGVYDMVGNLHEWVADPNGTFQGGYYQDTHLNGEGCTYKTMAHAAWYHDYSTGFRCCADPEL